MCGIIGIHQSTPHSTKQAANLAASMAFLGLHAQQHRGQESAGIITFDSKGNLNFKIENGLANTIFDEQELEKLTGTFALAHNRYSTAGDKQALFNAQPLWVRDSKYGPFALVHNGTLHDTENKRAQLEQQGAAFQTTSDTEIIIHKITRSRAKTFIEAVKEALKGEEGAYSLIFLSMEGMIAIRDPRGFRPLVYGEREDGSTIFASETCALDAIGAKYLGEILPGQMCIVQDERRRFEQVFSLKKLQQCIFELVYLARPDSNIFGKLTENARFLMGRYLADEWGIQADIVIPVPASGIPSAQGFAERKGIPMRFALVRNHYTHRTFIQPHTDKRIQGVKLKLNPVRELIEGKRVALIDDSIVRGTTSGKIVQMVRDAGAKEIHFGVSSSPIISPCYYGIDTPKREDLIAATMSTEEMARKLKVNSLQFLSLPSLIKACGGDGFCTSCLDGKYPTTVPLS